ncbi:MAG: heme o synthase [Alphaproteobacteria bacterium]
MLNDACEGLLASEQKLWRFQSDLSTAKDYWELLKPRVMALVVFTGWVGFILAPGQLHPLLGLTAILCIAVGAGAAGALNMWYERDLDGRMSRTQQRPLPQGRIQPPEALGFGLFLAMGSVGVLGLALNLMASFWLGFTIFFYVVVYTMLLKRRTPQNIVIGGASGALPPVVGWAAISPEFALAPWVLFLIIFLWTPAHFWALALLKQADYKKAGIPMMPVVQGVQATKRHIYAYTWLTVGASFLPCWVFMEGVSWIYMATCSFLGGYFIFSNHKLLKAEELTAYAFKSFMFSIAYLFLVFAALAFDGLAHLLGISRL